MRLEATLKVPGVVLVGYAKENASLLPGVFIHLGKDHQTADAIGCDVYVDGHKVGELTSPVRVDSTPEYTMGEELPVDHIVGATYLDVILELPSRE